MKHTVTGFHGSFIVGGQSESKWSRNKRVDQAASEKAAVTRSKLDDLLAQRALEKQLKEMEL